MSSIEKMIEEQLLGRDIHDVRVLRAMGEVDRALFVPDELKHLAYEDTPLPIGHEQTISQPYIVAYMAQSLELQPDDRVLEVGSGCGYSAAILSRLVKHVYTIEIIEWLTQVGRKNLQKAGIKNVSLRHGNGYQGWPEEAPFDKILLTAAAAQIPDPLKDQVKKGGSILAPVADHIQKLVLLKKNQEDIFTEHQLIYVSFVPMTGQAPPKPMK